MTDNFSPDNLSVSDDQMGLWDTPPEPPDFWDEPPANEWIPPEPPEGWIPPTPPAVEPAVTSNTPADPMAAISDAPAADEPFAEPFVPQAALPDAPAYVPSDTWERYLASFTPDKNPDILDSEERSRGQELNLLDARFVG